MTYEQISALASASTAASLTSADVFLCSLRWDEEQVQRIRDRMALAVEKLDAVLTAPSQQEAAE